MGLLLYSTQVIDMIEVTTILDTHNGTATYEGVFIYTTSEGALTVVNSFPTEIDACLGKVEGGFSVAWPIEGRVEIPNIVYFDFDEVEHLALASIEGGRLGHHIEIWYERTGGYKVIGHDFYENTDIVVQYTRLGWVPYQCTVTELGIWVYVTDISSGYLEA